MRGAWWEWGSEVRWWLGGGLATHCPPTQVAHCLAWAWGSAALGGRCGVRAGGAPGKVGGALARAVGHLVGGVFGLGFVLHPPRYRLPIAMTISAAMPLTSIAAAATAITAAADTAAEFKQLMPPLLLLPPPLP